VIHRVNDVVPQDLASGANILVILAKGLAVSRRVIDDRVEEKWEHRGAIKKAATETVFLVGYLSGFPSHLRASRRSRNVSQGRP
jgi:hypothetical protein